MLAPEPWVGTQQFSSSVFVRWDLPLLVFWCFFYSSQLLAGESLQAEVSVSTEIEQITWKTARWASPDVLFTCRHGTSTWCKIIASLLAPVSPVNFSPHPSPPHSNPSKHLLDSSRGCPVAGVFWILFPLLPYEEIQSKRWWRHWEEVPMPGASAACCRMPREASSPPLLTGAAASAASPPQTRSAFALQHLPPAGKQPELP